jgi:hypothetical protein
VDPSNVFRIGTDGNTAPLPAVGAGFAQPYVPGISGAPANDATVLDKNYRPQRTDNVTISIQRQLSAKSTLEVGYIGRIIRNEFQEINLDAVPTMMTLGGQTFANAWANIFWPVNNAATATSFNLPAQPFFEQALGGASSASCTGFANCTSMVATNFRANIRNGAVSDFWASMYKLPSWTLGRTMISQNLPSSLTAGGATQSQGTAFNETTSFGYGNYNAMYVSFRLRDWKGITATSNFTWGKGLGTGTLAQYNSSNTALNPWDPHADYGLQGFDAKFIYNAAIFWQSSSVFHARGVVGQLVRGWTVSPLFTAQSGPGIFVGYSEGSCSGCQAFGEATPPASTSAGTEGAVALTPLKGSTSASYNTNGTTAGTFGSNPTGVNYFANPDAAVASFRKCVLGFDTSCGGFENFRGMPRWNVDAAFSKNIGVWKEGRVGADLSIQVTNILNHMQLANPTLTLTTPTTFGRITGAANTPRNMEFGLRVHF